MHSSRVKLIYKNKININMGKYLAKIMSNIMDKNKKVFDQLPLTLLA